MQHYVFFLFKLDQFLFLVLHGYLEKIKPGESFYGSRERGEIISSKIGFLNPAIFFSALWIKNSALLPPIPVMLPGFLCIAQAFSSVQLLKEGRVLNIPASMALEECFCWLGW